MKIKCLPVLSLLVLGLCGCEHSKKNKNDNVVSQRYIHKYGYDVSKDDWNANHYPGQIVTTLKNGITISSSYEDGILHGATSYTYPHSQTLESVQIFERGNLIKRTSYDIKGIPQKEEIFISPVHVKTKYWYTAGTPMSIEESLDGSLMEADYFNLHNSLESKVENGMGIKTIRSPDGMLLEKDTIQGGLVVAKETFHPNGSPHMIVTGLENGVIHGDKKLFTSTGAPLLVESYKKGKLHGTCTYYQNGCKYLEIPYHHGVKDGIERHYIDGESIAEETEYHLGIKHGPSVFYSDGLTKTEWYYNNEFVSKAKFEELTDREKMISIMNDRAKPKFSQIFEDESDSIEFDN